MNIIDCIEELIRIPSVSREESEIFEFIASFVGGESLYYRFGEIGTGTNIIAVSKPHPGRPFILLNGHHDTVAVAEGWNTDPFEPVWKGDRLYGLGAHDMKAGLAMIMNLFCQYRDRLNLIFTAVGDEESDSMGSFALFQEGGALEPYLNRISGVLVTEPTFEKVMLGARGRYALKVTVHGKAAHGARPARGINAIDRASRIIAALKDLPMDSHELLGEGSYCVLKIRGGTETLSVPDSCEMIIDRHYTNTMTEEDVVREFSVHLSKHSQFQGINQGDDRSGAVREDVQLIEREVPFLEPYHRSIDEPFIAGFFDSVGKSGKDVVYGASVGDFNIFGSRMPTIVYGPDGGNHHSADEFVLGSSINRVYAQLEGWLDQLARQT